MKKLSLLLLIMLSISTYAQLFNAKKDLSLDYYSKVNLYWNSANENNKFFERSESKIHTKSVFKLNDKSSCQKISSLKLTNKESSILTSDTSTKETPFRYAGCSFNVMFNFMEDDWVVNDTKYSSSSFNMYIAYDHRLSNTDIGLGFDIGYGDYSLREDNIWIEEGVSSSTFFVGPKLAYHLPLCSFLDPYVSLSALYLQTKTDFDSNSIEDYTIENSVLWYNAGFRLVIPHFIGFTMDYNFKTKTTSYGVLASF